MSGELERARRSEPAWDDLRERRVLSRVLAARGEGAARRRRARAVVAAGAGLAVAAAAWVAWLRPSAIEPSVIEEPAAVATVAPEGEAGTSRTARISLRDGSEVLLAASADVRVESESADAVRISQLAGEARYVVSHRPERSFVVALEDVEVRVRGTRFVVRRGALEVEVEVEEGRVEVARGADATMLGAGEALRVRLRADEAVSAEAENEVEAEAEPEPEVAAAREARPVRRETIESLIAQADAARREGRLDDAARALRAATSLDPRDPRAATAHFQLGRVERSRGRHAAAAEAFEASLGRAPDGALAEDALAEAAVSWSAAGRRERARAMAQRYLALHPSGLYAERVRPLAE